jgi:hypothetical protein
MPRQAAAPRFSYDHDPHMRSSTAVRAQTPACPNSNRARNADPFSRFWCQHGAAAMPPPREPSPPAVAIAFFIPLGRWNMPPSAAQ